MKKAITIGMLFLLVFVATTACASKLKGADTSLELNESLCEDNQDQNKEWGTLDRFIEDDLFGFKTEDGEVAIEPQYYVAHSFSEGLAFVIGVEGREDQTGFIDTTGTLVIPLPTAMLASRFSEGFAYVVVRAWDYANETPLSVSLPGPFIFIDREGKDVFGREFGSVASFSQGFARVSLPGGNSAFIDRTGANAFDMEFRSILDFSEDGYARVVLLNGTVTHIDTDGNIVSRD